MTALLFIAVVASARSQFNVDQLPISVRFLTFAAEYGGATDAECFERTVNDFKFSEAERRIMQGLLADSVPSEEPIEMQLARARFKLTDGSLLFADKYGILGSDGSKQWRAMSASSLVKLSDLFRSREPHLAAFEDNTYALLPTTPYNPVPLRSPGKPFNQQVVFELSSVKTRTIWPPTRAEALEDKSVNVVKKSSEVAKLFKESLSQVRRAQEGLDVLDLWFEGSSPAGERISADRYGRFKIRSTDGREQGPYEMLGTRFVHLHEALVRLKFGTSYDNQKI